VRRQPIAGVLVDAVVTLSALPGRVDVDRHAAKVEQVVDQLVPHLPGDVVSAFVTVPKPLM